MKRPIPLAWRGYLLVAFPLACQLVFVVALVVLLWNLQASVVQGLESRQIISMTHRVVIKAGQLAGVRSALGHILGSEVMETSRKQCEADAEKLVATLNRYPKHRQQAIEMHEALRDLFALADKVYKTREQGNPGLPYVGSMYTATKRVQDLGTAITGDEQASMDADPARSQEFRTRIVACLGIALGASILLAVFLGFVYAKAIRQPLQRITQNGLLLSRRRPLLPPLASADELGELDRLLHTVANEVNRAAERERAMFDNAADLICSMDENGRFLSANPFVRRMLGLEPEQLLSLTLFDVVIPEDVAAADEQLRVSINRPDLSVFELRLRAADGRVLDTRWSSLWAESEKSLFCIVQDVTEQRKVERLKEDFFGMISHDLRSPLSSLYGSLKLIVAGAKGPVSAEVQQETLTAANNVERLVRFVNDLLDFQKLKSGKMELDLSEFDLLSVISEGIDLVRSFAQNKGVQITAPSGQWDIIGDRQKLVQAMVNLLGNAIKFTAPNSTITVDVLEDYETIEVGVTDCGPGVPEEFREVIFNAFEQVPGSAKIKQGTGLGLAICKLVVKGHKGTIGCRPASQDRNGGTISDASGTTFWFRIPKFKTDQVVSAIQMQIFNRDAEKRADDQMNAGIAKRTDK